MMQLVHLSETRLINVRVDLRRRNRCVPKHVLNGPNVRTVRKHMRGEAVPQNMW